MLVNPKINKKLTCLNENNSSKWLFYQGDIDQKATLNPNISKYQFNIMRKSIRLFALVLWSAIALFTSCSKEEVNYRSVTGNVDPASIEKSSYEAYLPFEASTYVITKGRGIDSSKVVVGGAAKFVPGQRGYAYQGDTLKSYLTIPLLSSNFLKNLKEFTFSSWVKIPVVKNNRLTNIFMIDGGDVTFGTLSLSIDSLNLKGFIRNTSSDTAVKVFNYEVKALRSSIKANDWVHIAFTYEKATSKLALYANGQLLSEVTCYTDQASTLLMGDLTLSPTMTKLYIGAWPQLISGTSSSMAYFSGALDEMRFWSKCLSREAVSSVYQAELALASNH